MMKIIKQRGGDSQGWYYADSGDRRVSPVFEHEGVLEPVMNFEPTLPPDA
jgi:hypothetical protein